MPPGGDSVKVAVRVRPFNQREKTAGSKCVIAMSGTATTITNPSSGETKTFNFDHSYWSHDGFVEAEDGIYKPESESSPYADQQRVFADLGRGVLDNAWQGYNAALFAYGQTGSGKSYSMVGYGANKGIVPITCGQLFQAIHDNSQDDMQLRVMFSMVEIYNEQVRDLLTRAKPQAGGLKVRQSSSAGFYVEGLKQVPVQSYKELERLMEQGTVNRTTASTNMNATSSRSHMVITIKFQQVYKNSMGESTTKSSDINLVDLAGSERANSTGATGDRLKEGSAINQSLSTLGNVISALADKAMGKSKVIVPYRDSVLTKLLQSALGGNSRTIMIAALSPADINFDETLSTLRYADRAKKIKNQAVVNENPTERLIRQLKEENARLMEMLQKQMSGKSSGKMKDVEAMLAENERKMTDINLTWTQRLEQAKHEWEQEFMHERPHAADTEKLPHFLNVNEDPQLTAVIKHCFSKGKTVIGRPDTEGVNVAVKGLGIQPQHAVVDSDGTAVSVEPCSDGCQLFVNGLKVKHKRQLKHLDRIKLGTSGFFLFVGFPAERKTSSIPDSYNYDFFLTELAEHEGVVLDLQTPRSGEDKDILAMAVFQDYVDILPVVMEANAISEELKKNVKFDAEVKSAASHDTKGKARGKEVIVRVTNVATRKVWVWSRDKFRHRKSLMDELYLRSLEGGSAAVERDKDPFWDPVEDVFLGSCHVWLQSLTYSLDVDEHFTLHNYHGREECVVHVHLQPCSKDGRPLPEESMLEPAELLGQPFHVLLRVPQFMGVRWVVEDPSRGIYLKFRFFGESKPVVTPKVTGTVFGDFDFQKLFSFKKASPELLAFLQKEALLIELWGTQDTREVDFSSAMKSPDPEEQYSQLKKDNFKLKQDHEKQKEALLRSKNGASGHKKEDMTGGLDIELAKALQSFFKEIRSVQQNIKDIRTHVTGMEGEKVNGHVTGTLDHLGGALQSTDQQLSSCVQSLKQSVADTIRKSRKNGMAAK